MRSIIKMMFSPNWVTQKMNVYIAQGLLKNNNEMQTKVMSNRYDYQNQNEARVTRTTR